jgi:DNA-binding NarL/FixJ family response regulator
MLREGLRAVLESSGIQVVGEAGTGHEAIAEAARLQPDVVVIDTTLPGLNGIDATRRIVADRASNKILALSVNADRRCVIAMLEAGAAGFLLMDASSAELLAGLVAVNRGETYLSPAIAKSVVQQAIRGGATSPRSEATRRVSAREREVLQLVAEGKSSKEIATTLRLAVSTVETHRRAIMGKLDLRSIAALTKYAIREGLTSAAA